MGGWLDAVGLTLFQRIIPRPGLASGLYTNTRRLGAIASGQIIGFGSMTAYGYQGIFAVCAALALVAMVVLGVTGRTPKPDRKTRDGSTPASTILPHRWSS
ncbi:sugar efflux protein [Arthrobacter sp. Hiyo6]|nr:sugar efflux protein [Arthrobacter sp. Hiyo6]